MFSFLKLAVGNLISVKFLVKNSGVCFVKERFLNDNSFRFALKYSKSPQDANQTSEILSVLKLVIQSHLQQNLFSLENENSAEDITVRGARNHSRMGYIKLLQCGNLAVSAYSSVIKRVHHKKYCFSHVLEFILPYSTRSIYNMRSAYFQREQEQETVRVNVNYDDNDVKGTLNFQRPLVESMESFLKRVQSKLQLLVMKKVKKKIKNLNSDEILPNIDVSLLLNKEVVSGDMKFQDIFQNILNGELKLKINDTEYDVFLNFPMVKAMTLPKKLFAGTVAFPETLETEYMDEKNSNYVWYKSRNSQSPKNWQKCGEGFFYFIKEEDIGYYLKVVCTPKMGEKVGPEFELISSIAVEEFKAFEEINKRHEFTKETTNPDEFRIVSYNILAYTYTQTKEAKTELFTFCDPAYMDFTYRKTLCISELLGYNADVICLQEVDRSHHCGLELLFSKKGYSCLYHEKEGTREGCTLMFNDNKFNLLTANQYTFNKELLTNPWLDDIKVKIEGNENLMTRIQRVQSQIQVVVLESCLKHVLIIGNTHFYFHPDADHIRLLQGLISWRILQSKYEEIKEKVPDRKVSVILCGDFNSTPECGFHEFLNTGFVGSEHIDWKSKEDEAIKDLSCEHSFKLKSAYDNTQYTNYTPLFKGCLDYIYYQTDHLKLKRTVPIPSEEVLSRCVGIPSEFFPSDHVALIADLKFEV